MITAILIFWILWQMVYTPGWVWALAWINLTMTAIVSVSRALRD